MEFAILAKLGLIIMGVGAAERSFRAYRARRRDPHMPPDRASDLAWRGFGIGVALVIAAFLALTLVHDSTGRVPRWLLDPSFAVLIAGIAVLFVAAFVIGVRSP